jgi:hypothetical protein
MERTQKIFCNLILPEKHVNYKNALMNLSLEKRHEIWNQK